MLNEKKVLAAVKAKQAKKQKGASMIEYALVVAAIVGIAGTYFGTDGSITTAVTDKLDAVAADINPAP